MNNNIATGTTRMYKVIANSNNNHIALREPSGFWTCTIMGFDSLGYSATNDLSGKVFQDNNTNCSYEGGDIKLEGWVVKAENTQGTTSYATTDSLGYYSMLVSSGNYNLSLLNTSSYYTSSCQPSFINKTFNGYYLKDSIDFALTSSTLCPLLNVDISAPFIRPTGTGSNYTVSYCNTGTIDAQNAYVEVELDPTLNVLGSSIPINTQTGNIYTFNIGTVAVGECGSFALNVIPDTSAFIGQTICTKANIFPDSICIPGYWSGPILETSALCVNDTITFNVFNKGAPMSQGTQYFVYEDNVMFKTGTTNTLGSSGSQQFKEYALPGKSYRFEVKQIPGFPALLGDSVASASIEGCQPLANGTFSTGFITQLSNGNRSPFIAVDCQQMIAAYDPNDKSAQPEGYSTPHYIYDYTPLDYKVRFQNTGTDTAFRVVIRDTLSAHLDVTSLEMGAASHDYTWRIYDQGILEITFANIMLPDSNVNEPASNGFFRFRINQMPNNPLGTVINNSAAIYFDYNSPIITNTTYHTIGDNFVSVILTGVDEVLVDKDIEVKFYPNPFEEEAILEVVGGNYQDLELVVYDITGREVSQYISTGNQKIQIQRKDLPSGIYIYQLKGDRELISTGKVIIK
ncbi:MAG: T9SS type A sorting domain-containing protein [Aureispira sp.]|nr:T9SS type A sorting domain-containing protein [Aureispira sp.]